MVLDYESVTRIIGENPRFSRDLEGYDIIGEEISDADTRLYLEKLKYAAQNADSLISSAL